MRYKDETISVVRQSLANEKKPQTTPHPNPIIQSFWDLGVEIRSTGTPGIFYFHPSQLYLLLS